MTEKSGGNQHPIDRKIRLPVFSSKLGLARALHFRVYARLNTQHTYFEEDGALVFEMNVCRVGGGGGTEGPALPFGSDEIE